MERTDCITVTRQSIETGELKDPTQTFTACPTLPEAMWAPPEVYVEEEDEQA
jgi:hypothetical protein